MVELTFRGMSIGQFLIWFFIYSFIGWVMECIVIRIQLGRWENRGFARLPFCVIYGFGVFLAMILFKPIENNYVALYIVGALSATTLEYITALVMLRLFGKIWWNYDHLPFNYKGILCLESTLGWGLVALIVFGFLNNVIETLVKMIDVRFATAIGGALLVMYVLDFAQNFVRRLDKGEDEVFEAICEDDSEELETAEVGKVKQWILKFKR